jgi:hypothetical protein
MIVGGSFSGRPTGDATVHKTLVAFVAVFLAVGSVPVLARDAANDGTYDAQVTTESGDTYSVPVEVEDGAVTQVHWPNGGNMNVEGGDLEAGEAMGTNSRGENVSVEIDDPGYNASPSDE